MVLGPATDGGYYLIGLKTAHPRLFEDVKWGSDVVFAETLSRAGEIGLPLVKLASWYDVDDAESFAILRAELRGQSPEFAGGGAAAATRFWRRSARSNRQCRSVADPAAAKTQAPHTMFGLAALGATGVALTAWSEQLVEHDHLGFLLLVGTQSLIALAGAVVACRAPDTARLLAIVVVFAIAPRLYLMLQKPTLSGDIYRYVWDGRVDIAGFNPFLHVPASPELAFLRTGRFIPGSTRRITPLQFIPRSRRRFLPSMRCSAAG